MSIRYDDELKARIKRVAKNFNRKRKYQSTKTRGKGDLPEPIYARKIMDKYSDKSRSELEKQLKLYQSFGQRDALDRVSSDSRISKWEYNFFKSNMDKTQKFYDDEISDLQRIIGDDLGSHLRISERLINLQRKREYLDKDLTSLTETQIETMRSIFNYAERSELVKQQGFRLYLNQLERTMGNLGYSESEIDELLNKFNVLSENEFIEMVRNEDLIDVIYDLVDSPKQRGTYELTMDEERARSIIEELAGRADSLIAKYKTSK